MTSLDRIIKIINNPYLDELRNALKNNKEFLDTYYDKELENLISNNPKLETEALAIPIDSLIPVIKGMILNDARFKVFPTYQEFGIHVFNTYMSINENDRKTLEKHIDYDSLGKTFTNGDETYVFKDTNKIDHGSMVIETVDGSDILPAPSFVDHL